jgi:hypothetical protein
MMRRSWWHLAELVLLLPPTVNRAKNLGNLGELIPGG